MHEALKDEFMSMFIRLRKMRESFPKNEELTFVESTILHQIFFLSKDQTAVEVRVSDLKAFFGVTNPAISQSLNTLQDKGYICRSISAGDRRSVALTLTDKGKDVLKCNAAQMSGFLDVIIDKMGPENMRRMIELFTQMTDAVIDMKQNKTQEERLPHC